MGKVRNLSEAELIDERNPVLGRTQYSSLSKNSSPRVNASKYFFFWLMCKQEKNLKTLLTLYFGLSALFCPSHLRIQ